MREGEIEEGRKGEREGEGKGEALFHVLPFHMFHLLPLQSFFHWIRQHCNCTIMHFTAPLGSVCLKAEKELFLSKLIYY